MVDAHLDILTYNQNALNNLRRAVVLGQGQFSLILAQVNYQRLRQVLIAELAGRLRFEQIPLPPTATRLKDALLDAAPEPSSVHPRQALMVTGLETVRSLEPFLKAANLGRDELPKVFHCPVVLWVNNTTLQQLNRYAPDLKSFAATPIRFEYPTPSLIAVLSAQADDTFAQILETRRGISLSDRLPFSTSLAEPLASQELSFALAQLESHEHLVSNDLIADLLFLEGRNLHQQQDFTRARSYYEDSLRHWQHHSTGKSATAISSLDKQAVLLFHLGLWWRIQAASKDIDPDYAYPQAKRYFEDCLAIFRQQDRPDRVGRFILALAEVLQKQADWSGLAAIAQTSLDLHRNDPARLARDYGYLAEIALARYETDPYLHYLNEAQGFAQQALEISGQVVQEQKARKQESEDCQIASEIALRYHRGHYFYLLAIAGQLQGQSAAAISQLEKARQHTDPRYDLALYRRILDQLWQLYFEHRHYAQAFEVKLAQRRVENLFGLRAFIGASQIRPPVARSLYPEFASSPDSSPDSSAETLAAEIKASGRAQDIEALVSRLSQPRYPIVVIHGQSGVGKSSTLSAGLVPRLRSLISEGRTTQAVLIDSYSNWVSQLAAALMPLADGQKRESPSASLSSHSLIDQLTALTREKYQQIVLVFDQFEDFFYEHPAVAQRRDLYIFLRDCLDLPYIKVVLALREDFLHYLLEWDRSADLSAVENDILSKEIRYYLGNFTTEATETVIWQLTQAAEFYLEDGLITALVNDLAAETGEVRPIELQVVGAQLQREQITTLAQYQQLGRSPKAQLLNNFLGSVIHDCGAENSTVASAILYLLSEDNNRPVKSLSELEEALMLANIRATSEQLMLVLNIFIGSGLVFEVLEVSGARYQLVHEYLAGLIQQQPGPIEALQTERRRRHLRADQPQAAPVPPPDPKTATQAQEIAEMRALMAEARSLQHSGDPLEALAKAVQAAQQVRKHTNSPLLKLQAALCLSVSLRHLSEDNALILRGHVGPVWGARWSPQAHSSQLLTAGGDDTIGLWNDRGEQLKSITGHRRGVHSVAWGPAGNFFASASADHSVRIWSAAGQAVRSLLGHEAAVWQVCYSADGRRLASVSSDRTLRLWHSQGPLLKTWREHTDTIWHASFSPEGRHLITASEDHTLRLWHVETGLVQTLTGHKGGVWCAVFSPNGQQVASGGADGLIRLWSVTWTDHRLRLAPNPLILRGHQDWVRCLSFSPTGEFLASASDDGTVRLWSLIPDTLNLLNSPGTASLELPVLLGHTGVVWEVAFDPQGDRLVSASADGTVRIWDLRLETLIEKGCDQI